MDSMEAILTRRSIRKYTNRPVSEDLVEEFLKAGMSAPSARNKRPWHFVVINNRQILDEIPKFHPYAQMLHLAPLAILICGSKKLQPVEGYIVQDCSAATQNILLAVHSKGLGAVWVGIYPRKERMDGIRKLLNIPPDIIPISLISIGYPDEQKQPINRYDPSRIHHNKW